MRVLVTRPAEDAEDLVAALAARGIEALVAPMLAIAPRAGATLDLDDAQAILVTSANGARVLGALTTRRDLPVLAVGAASAAAARAAGFADVRAAGGDVAALAGLARSSLDPTAGVVVHVAAGAVAGDLAGDLGRMGFRVRRVAAYDATPATALPESVCKAFGDGTIAAVLLFSPRTAATFVDLARSARVTLTGVGAVCLSQAVAAKARALAWRKVRVAARPDTPALLEALDGLRRDDDGAASNR